MDRHWLLTSTTYGYWLPGDARGFVSEYRGEQGEKILENIPGTPYAKDMPGIQEHARVTLKDPPIVLTAAQAEVMFRQFYETATKRGWKLFAVGGRRSATGSRQPGERRGVSPPVGVDVSERLIAPSIVDAARMLSILCSCA
jgi:hypothetical protein